MRFEETETPGYVRLVTQDAQAMTLNPQEALDLLHWLFERREVLEQILHPEPPTQKLPRITPPTANN